ncbi:kinesin-like protein KIF15 [Liolophura sinensis]|uniref:kinesin-like protein KIF15 n=1 Tax=Liolophura sinensis TaxID=3198878 RepID=UPI0031593D1C
MATEAQEVGNSAIDQVEVEMVLKQFDHWQQAVMSLQRTRSDLMDKLAAKGKENQELQQRNVKLRQELTDMHEAIDGIQKQLQYICTLQDDVETLKSKLHLEKHKTDDLNKKVADMQEQHEQEIVELKEKHNTDMQTAVESSKAEGHLLIDKLNRALSERDITINGLHGQLQQAESEKQAEVVRITMEFESKIAKLQRQKLQSCSAAQSSAAAQEIFRKKLQFMKAESEKEISALKQTIAELRQKVTNLQREPTKLSLSIGKKRRY